MQSFRGRYSAIGLMRAAERFIAVLRFTQSIVAPFFDLTIRLWLAQLVWLPMAARSLADAPMGAATGASMRAFPILRMTAHPTVAIIEIVGPPLLALGLGTRIVALPMALVIIQALQAHAAPPLAQLDLALLFGWYMIVGAGPLSLDRAVARGIFDSALPFANLAGWMLGGLKSAGTPIMLMAVRLTLAASLLTPFGTAGTMAWALILVLGLLTRVAALPLLGVAAMTMMVDPSAVLLARTLLVVMIVVYGPGSISVDGLIVDRLLPQLKRRWSGAVPSVTAQHRVVIIGGGFGGIATAKSLRHCDCAVTLIDQHNYHLFQPLLYQVATGGLSPADIAVPIRGLFRDQANARILFGRVEAVDPMAKMVRTADGNSIGYDTLVIATGAKHAYFGHDAWEPYAPGLKTIDDATDVRRRILLAFERAENAQDAVERAALLTFAIIGGGPTGVELAGAIAELARHGLAHEFRAIDPAQARVILFQAGDRVLPTLPESLSAAAAEALKAAGVEVRTDAMVGAVDGDGLLVGDQRIACRTTFWAAGVAASPAAAWLGAASDRAGRLVVGPDLSVPDRPEIFAIGDTALAHGWAGKPVPGLAPAAKQGGHYVAAVIRARLEDKAPPPAFRYRHAGSLATIGRRAAVADFGWIKLSGPLAWWLWGGIHVLFLAGARNRLSVMIEWFWAYLTFGRGTRLITGDRDTPLRTEDHTLISAPALVRDG